MHVEPVAVEPAECQILQSSRRQAAEFVEEHQHTRWWQCRHLRDLPFRYGRGLLSGFGTLKASISGIWWDLYQCTSGRTSSVRWNGLAGTFRASPSSAIRIIGDAGGTDHWRSSRTHFSSISELSVHGPLPEYELLNR